MEQTQKESSSRQQGKGKWVLVLGFLVWAAIFLFAVFDKAPPQ